MALILWWSVVFCFISLLAEDRSRIPLDRRTSKKEDGCLVGCTYGMLSAMGAVPKARWAAAGTRNSIVPGMTPLKIKNGGLIRWRSRLLTLFKETRMREGSYSLRRCSARSRGGSDLVFII